MARCKHSPVPVSTGHRSADGLGIDSPWAIWSAAGIIMLMALVAYHNSFSGPFVFDDVPAIVENPTIRQLWPLGPVLSPPHEKGFTVSGRPLTNLSFAVNYALGNTTVTGYHAGNLVLHIMSALILFGVVRRTLQQPVVAARYADQALWLSATVAILWVVHPLQTAAVTYMVQRAELLMAFFYLLTLYGFIRATSHGGSPFWFVIATTACWLGMVSKEVMVTAPVMVLLYDRIFVSGSFARAWTQHRRLYLVMATSWILLAWLMAGTGGRGGTVGFAADQPWWNYALIQLQAIPHYLGLVFWPHGLVFDHGITLPFSMLRIAAGVTVMAIGLVASSLAWRKWPALGFTAAAFFLVLAPTSSVVPILSQVMAEHRMYLPLAAVVTIVVLGLDAIVHRWAKIIFAGLAVALTLVTVDRNKVYGSELMLWSDTVERVPYNARAHYNLGLLLADGGRADEAKHEYETVIRLEPGDADARNKLGRLLLSEGQSGAAIAEFTEALRINPEYGDAHNNLAVALVQEGRFQDALTHFAEGIRLQPAVFEAYFNFGNALVQMDRLSEARLQYEKALRLRPDSTLARDMMARIDIYLNRQ